MKIRLCFVAGGKSQQYNLLLAKWIIKILYFYFLLVIIWYPSFPMMSSYQMMKATVSFIPLVLYVDILVLKYLQTWYKNNLNFDLGIILVRSFFNKSESSSLIFFSPAKKNNKIENYLSGRKMYQLDDVD